MLAYLFEDFLTFVLDHEARLRRASIDAFQVKERSLSEMKLTFSEQFNKAQQSSLCPRFYQDLLAYGEQMRQLMKTEQFFDLQLDFLTRQIQSFKTTLSLNKVKVLQNAQALD